MDNKRKRSSNFTEREKMILLELINERKKIIENKKTDGTSNSAKYNTWQTICNAYNAQQTSGIRNVDQLKHIYDTMKRKARKDRSTEKVELYKTGGGEPNFEKDPISEKVIDMLAPQLTPLATIFDCDAGYNDKEDVLLEICPDATEHEDTTINEIALINIPNDISTISSVITSKATLEVENLAGPSSTTATATPKAKRKIPLIPKRRRKIRNVYEGLENLTNKHLTKIKTKEDYIEKIYSTKLLTAELELESKRRKKDADDKEAKLREEILLTELESAKINLQINKKKVENLTN